MISLRNAVDAAEFGGKAAQLAQALNHGLPVPDGVAMSFECARRYIERPDREIFTVFDGPVAVRSSAIGEDSDSASFAGQHATVLGAHGAAAIENAVLQVYESAHNEGALAYRRQMGITALPEMGIVIQSLIQSEVAGVLFTVNPVTGADERVLEASWGLGEVVVQGLVVPDHFRAARGGRLLEARPGHKDVALRYTAGGASEVPVPADDVGRICLESADLSALDALATRCESIFGGLQDIEWAFDRARNLYLLQRRPLTTRPAEGIAGPARSG